MRDSELTARPGKGWTPWEEGQGDSDIEKIWWALNRFPNPVCSTTKKPEMRIPSIVPAAGATGGSHIVPLWTRLTS